MNSFISESPAAPQRFHATFGTCEWGEQRWDATKTNSAIQIRVECMHVGSEIHIDVGWVFVRWMLSFEIGSVYFKVLNSLDFEEWRYI